MPDVTAVQFENAQGHMLHGILERPESGVDRSIGIIMLSPGIKMRIAPHQLYNKMSKRFVALGYTVLRFDFYGLGDSEGLVEEKLLADLYRSIQLGRYIDDTLCAIRWLSDKCGIDKVILSGLCGGAITGLLAARSDERVYGLLGLGIPVILDGSKVDSTKYITDGQLNRLHKGYLSRVFSLKSWGRLLSFQSDYKVIWKIIRKILPAIPARKILNKPSAVTSQKPDNDNTNPLFAPAVIDMMNRKRNILFIFSGSDRLGWEYEEKFSSIYKKNIEDSEKYYQVRTIPEANHILSMSNWQHQMLEMSCHWLSTVSFDKKAH